MKPRRLVLLLSLATAACAPLATAVADDDAGPDLPPVEVVIHERIAVSD